MRYKYRFDTALRVRNHGHGPAPGYTLLFTVRTSLLHMPYLFHEPALSLDTDRSIGIQPGVALALAILGTTITTVVLAALVR